MYRKTFLTSLLGASLLIGCATTSRPVDVADSLAADPNLTTLNRLVDQAGLKPALKAAGPVTLFAPSNDAFKAVPAKTMEEMSANPALLRSVLDYHVVAGRMPAADLKMGNLKTVNGANIAIARAGTFVTVEDGMVQQPDRMATNGVIHVIDRVLIPPRR